MIQMTTECNHSGKSGIDILSVLARGPEALGDSGSAGPDSLENVRGVNCFAPHAGFTTEDEVAVGSRESVARLGFVHRVPGDTQVVEVPHAGV